MSPVPEPPEPPAVPAGGPVRPDRGPRRWIVLLLVLAALLGTGAAATLTGGAELRPAAAPASDPSGEIHDPAGAEAGLPGRSRRRRTRLRPVPPRRRPYAIRRLVRILIPAPVAAPRGDALRCVVMRC
ncbi:hypothetical protein [Streptomyces exfoliatus]|uniref:hypothetical protein n=1 Tax=Streptomyces exfoliatus TaxID=1905 RepID=UPI0004C9C648|nr:hypothetical protein [Streptomyces exfoliatus]